jgi:hypothetical protein
MPKLYSIIETHAGQGFNADNRYWKVAVGLKVYYAGVERGRSVRIAFKPRGENRGFHWHGFVRDEQGKTLVGDRVAKSTGLAHLLELAGLVPLRRSEMNKIHDGALFDEQLRDIDHRRREAR